MLKQILFVSAAIIAIPAIAQTTPAADPMAQPDTTTTPSPTTDPIATEPLAPSSTTPTPEQATPVTPAEPITQPAPAEPAQSATTATPAQVALIVEKEFPTYDKDATNDLNEAEFTAWMKTLRKSTEPALDTESAEIATWVSQAFAAADTDKSKAVSKVELAGFLTQAAG